MSHTNRMTDYLDSTTATPTPTLNPETTGTRPVEPVEATPPPITQTHIKDQTVAAATEAEPKTIEFGGATWTLAPELNEAGIALAAGMAESGEVQGMYHLVTMLLDDADGKRFVSEFIKQRHNTDELQKFIVEAIEVIGQRPLGK